MHVREQLEKLACLDGDDVLPEQLPALKLPKVAAVRQERGDDVLIFLGKQAAGGVDQPLAGFHEIRRGAAWPFSKIWMAEPQLACMVSQLRKQESPIRAICYLVSFKE